MWTKILAWFRDEDKTDRERYIEREHLVRYIRDRAAAWHSFGYFARADICHEIADDIEEGAP